jgi:hypothetical protein
MIMRASLLILVGAVLVALSTPTGATRVEPDACLVTPTVDDEPAKDPGADPFGRGPWVVNADRTIWVHSWTGPWHQGLNQKVMWIRPAGTQLKITGKRIDGDAPELASNIPCCYRSGFQPTRMTFPAAGCWKVTATAGDRRLEFIASVRPNP